MRYAERWKDVRHAAQRRERLRSAERRAGPRLRELGLAGYDDVLALFGTSEHGLGHEEAARRYAQHGPNRLSGDTPRTWYAELAQCYPNPFNLLLTGLALIGAALGDLKTTLILVLMISVGTLMRFVQEHRSARAMQQLRALAPATAIVRRREDRHGPETLWNPRGGVAVPVESLVPGDVVLLRAGDIVPADVRLLSANSFYLSQASLTGEALPVEKRESAANAWQAPGDDESVPALPNVACMGTSVVSGSALAVVVATGDATYFGTVAAGLRDAPAPTSFDRGVRSVSFMLIRFTLVLVPIVLLLNGLIKGDWAEALTFALAVGVGLTPEMLPVVVTAALARGALLLARHKVITKHLNAVQDIGAMDVLCVDKTGTLTRDRVALRHCVDTQGRDDNGVFALAYLNSLFQGGVDNLLDRAVLAQRDLQAYAAGYVRVAEIPFDSVRRRLSVVVRDVSSGDELLIAKGAVDDLLAVCTRERRGEAVLALTPERLAAAQRLCCDLEADGAGVVAVATRAVSHAPGFGPSDERELELRGFLAFVDPVKDDAIAAIAALRAKGIAIKVITGDNERVTRRVAERVGLAVDDVLAGSRIDRLGDAELVAAAARATLFVRTTPTQKARVVHALRATGRTVGYLGDGVNDAAALRAADVGITVDTAVPIARESADFVLLEKDLLVVEHAVVVGRRMFGNVLKYIAMTTSSNFGNVFSVLIASAFLPFVPMLPIQLIAQNLLYDLSQILLPWDRVDEEFVAQPQRWRPDAILRFTLCIGPISSVFDILTYALMWHVFDANVPGSQALFQTGWFVEGLLSQTLIVHMLRTRHLPFVRGVATWPLVAATATIVGVGIALPFTSLGASIGLVRLPGAYYAWLALILLEYAVAMQIGKTLYVRRFKEWL